MADYQDIRGLRVKYLSADPSNPEDGEVWYNSTTGTLRARVLTEAWSSATALPQGRDSGTGGGTQTAAYIAGGETTPGTFLNTTFEYDGATWTASGAMGNDRIRMDLGSIGTQTAGLGVGGYAPGITNAVEEYDGTNWAGGTVLPSPNQQGGGAGPQTAYLHLGGGAPTTCLSYNGASWASEGASSEGFAYYGLAGTDTAGLAFYGAESPPGTNRTTGEEYNGTSWTTAVATLPDQGNSGTSGGTTASAIFAGSGTTARYWNGTTVAAAASMANPRGNAYGAGSGTAFVASSGNIAPGAVEEYNFGVTTETLTTS